MNNLINPMIIAAFLGMAIAQILKVCVVFITEGRWAFDRLTETGGMPSSHSAAVSAIATCSGYLYGMDSPCFAICVVFGIIVIYDATGIRRAAGRHAEILNELLEEFSHLNEEGNQPEALKTLLGHTYPQVLVGSILGILVGAGVYYVSAIK